MLDDIASLSLQSAMHSLSVQQQLVAGALTSTYGLMSVVLSG